MKSNASKYIIVGAGLSGLTCAYRLLNAGIEDFIILEARSRVGGRIFTKNSVDMGATWFQDQHTQLRALCNELELGHFPQYQDGKSILIYNSMAPAHYFESDTSGAVAKRLTGGSSKLIDILYEKLNQKTHLNTCLTSISNNNLQLELKTNKGIFNAEKVIISLPPKLASNITYPTMLPKQLYTSMQKTHTWMSNAIKVGIKYNTTFWREKGLSGTIIGQIGPVIELYEHNCADNKTFGLMGFVNEALRELSPDERKQTILEYLAKHLGKESLSYVDYFEKDWSEDPYTSCTNIKSVYMSIGYGNPLYESFYLDGRLLFSGTETASQFGGYLEGAVRSGEYAAKMLIQHS